MNLFSQHRSVSILVISLLLSFSTVYAQPQATSIGKVLWVKGILKATQPQQAPRVLTRRSDIYESDTLTTDASSTGEITFTDNSLLSLRENTVMAIAKYRYGKNVPKARETYVEKLAKGGFRKITGAISHDHPDGYSSVTPVATIGVLGTEYSVFYTAQSGLATKLDRGSISVQNPAGKIILKKCTQDEIIKTNCKNQVYSRVTSTTSAPTIQTQQPPEFTHDVPIYQADNTTCPYCTTNPAANENNITNILNSSTGGVVSSFCVK